MFLFCFYYEVFNNINKELSVRRFNAELVDFMCYSQTTQTAQILYLDRLSRPIMSQHAMLRFHVMFFD